MRNSAEMGRSCSAAPVARVLRLGRRHVGYMVFLPDSPRRVCRNGVRETHASVPEVLCLGYNPRLYRPRRVSMNKGSVEDTVTRDGDTRADLWRTRRGSRKRV